MIRKLVALIGCVMVAVALTPLAALSDSVFGSGDLTGVGQIAGPQALSGQTSCRIHVGHQTATFSGVAAAQIIPVGSNMPVTIPVITDAGVQSPTITAEGDYIAYPQSAGQFQVQVTSYASGDAAVKWNCSQSGSPGGGGSGGGATPIPTPPGGVYPVLCPTGSYPCGFPTPGPGGTFPPYPWQVECPSGSYPCGFPTPGPGGTFPPFPWQFECLSSSYPCGLPTPIPTPASGIYSVNCVEGCPTPNPSSTFPPYPWQVECPSGSYPCGFPTPGPVATFPAFPWSVYCPTGSYPCGFPTPNPTPSILPSPASTLPVTTPPPTLQVTAVPSCPASSYPCGLPTPNANPTGVTQVTAVPSCPAASYPCGLPTPNANPTGVTQVTAVPSCPAASYPCGLPTPNANPTGVTQVTAVPSCPATSYPCGLPTPNAIPTDANGNVEAAPQLPYTLAPYVVNSSSTTGCQLISASAKALLDVFNGYNSAQTTDFALYDESLATCAAADLIYDPTLGQAQVVNFNSGGIGHKLTHGLVYKATTASILGNIWVDYR